MPTVPTTIGAQYIDLSQRVAHSATVVASPALAAETIIGSVTLPDDLAYNLGVWVHAWCAFTVGTSGVSAQLRVRQDSLTGTLIVDSGATTAAATNLNERSIDQVDTSPGNGQTYKFTLQVASGAAVSTVSAVSMFAIAI